VLVKNVRPNYKKLIVSYLSKLFGTKFAKSITGALGLNIIEVGLGFTTAMVLTRLMGSSNYGIYSYAMALAGVFTILALLGHDGYVVKTVARLISLKRLEEMSSFVKGAFIRTVFFNIVVSLILIVVLYFYQDKFTDDKFLALLIAISIISLTVLMRIYMSLFQGIQKIVTSLWPDKILRPLSFLSIVLAFALFSSNGITAPYAIAANAIAALFALLLVAYLWKTHKPYANSPNFRLAHLTEGWRPALPFALLASIAVLFTNIDVIMLGVYVSDSEIGIYRITGRVATLVSFASIAVRAAFNPRISMLFANKDFAALQSIASKAALANSLVAIPCLLIFIFAGYWVLILFGEDFTAGTDILTVLSIGQFIGSICALSASFLMMTSHANKATYSLVCGTVVNIVLNYILIPKYGSVGAAYATSIALTSVNVVNTYFVWTYLKINSTLFGFILKKY
jgi:O-antigen/teichoic acid export membrane protein